MKVSVNEFHVSAKIRRECNFTSPMYSSTGNVILADLKNVRAFAVKYNEYLAKHDKVQISAGMLNAMGLLDEIFHFASMMYRKTKYANAETHLIQKLENTFGKEKLDKLLIDFTKEFPPVEVYQGKLTGEQYLAQTCIDQGTGIERSNREATVEEMIMLHLANENPAFKPFKDLFDDTLLCQNELYDKVWTEIKAFYKELPFWGAYNHDLITFLKEPVQYSPDNIQEQLDYVRTHWSDLLVELESWSKRLLFGIDVLSEEWKPKWTPVNGGQADLAPPSYENLMKEYERFSPDKDWMPNVVLMAKTVLVWLDQLSKKYGRCIDRLDLIPDEELDTLRDEGFTGLWLIGLWQRSEASRDIKRICGNPEAAASAYSLFDYEIADNIGGWAALTNLRNRLWMRGIRLASDMVPNHTGMDAKWVIEKPNLFVQRRDNPFPQYTFNGPNLSRDSRVAVYLEDHYYSKSDCAVVFKRVDTYTGDTRYIYHGNDGTGMPWNDTAQIDFLNPEAREEVMQEILHVARNFPIIRFDAAMVLAKKHIRRLWYPEHGHGGDIATRSEYALTTQQFEDAIPQEFWREVVDRIAKEVPDTLLLAEAFWMMEGYFTRTLGMHRVYNSAFMNMLKKEENEKYRQTIQNTITFDPEVLKRFVNFMNNPDEETAVAQFGKGDKYFGVCTLMSTMPGLPMFGHGQLEGFEEKYGMEYTKAYKDESVDQNLLDRHKREIFPLLHKRYLFAHITNFLFYDVFDNGNVNQNIFAYSNHYGSEYAVVFYNNKYDRAWGWINRSCPYAVKTGSGENDKDIVTKTIGEGLDLVNRDDYYVMFQEQRSRLWFLRKNTDIINNGIFVSLNGFESQILLNFSQKQDTDGSLKTICSFLNGRGVPDIDEAWQDYHYRELHAALENVFSKDFIELVKLYIKPSDVLRKAKVKRPASKDIIACVVNQLTDLYTKMIKTCDDEKKSARKEYVTSAVKAVALAKAHINKLSVRPVQHLKQITDKKYLISQAYKSKTAYDFIVCGQKVNEKYLILLIIYALFVPFAKTEYLINWAWPRKLSQILSAYGIDKAFCFDFFNRAFIMAQKNCKSDITLICQTLINSEYASNLSGVNEYDNVKWFNKERFESSLYINTVTLMISLSEQKQEALLKEIKKLYNNASKSQYKCDILLESYKVKTVKKAKACTPKKTKATAKKAAAQKKLKTNAKKAKD